MTCLPQPGLSSGPPPTGPSAELPGQVLGVLGSGMSVTGDLRGIYVDATFTR